MFLLELVCLEGGGLGQSKQTTGASQRQEDVGCQDVPGEREDEEEEMKKCQ